MRALYSLELAALVKELKPMEGFRISRFYEIGDGRFLLRLRNGEERMNVQCILPYAIFSTDYSPQGVEPTSFALAARKRAEGARIESVGQLNNDRIVVIGLSKGGDVSNLILELFGRGNLIVTDSAMQITLAYSMHNFKDRSVRVKSEYKPPSGAPLDFINHDNVRNAIAETQHKDREAEALPALTRGIGIGTLYIEEALGRAGVPPERKISEISKKGFDLIADSIIAIIKECTDSQSPTLYMKDGAIVDFSLCPIRKYAQLGATKADSVQALLDAFYSQQVPVEAVKSREALELEKSLAKQRALLNQLDVEIGKCREGADVVMRNLNSINALVGFMRQNKRATKEEAQAAAQEIRILDVNLKDKTVRIDIGA